MDAPKSNPVMDDIKECFPDAPTYVQEQFMAAYCEIYLETGIEPTVHELIERRTKMFK